MRSSSPARTHELQLAAEQPLTGECRIPPREAAPHPRVKGKPQQDGRRGKIMFRIKPHTRQRLSEGSNRPCAHQDPETPQGLSQSCVWVCPVDVRVSRGLLRGQGLGVQQTWVWHRPSWRKMPLTHHRAARTYTGWGQTLGGHSKTL